MTAAISVSHLNKTYNSGFQALKDINLEIRHGEIFALLGPNGAGKTTLINVICGIVKPSTGTVTVDGHDILADYRASRTMIGLVPQELTTDAFETPPATMRFSRGLFGKPPNPAIIEKVLKDLSLWDKKDSRIMTLSGGMKRRVLIAKALAHEPQILFLDEPTAGVDVELRKDMWQLVRALRASGVTIILTTHYIEEAEEMADRVGVINKGEIILIEDKVELMRKLGRKQLTLELHQRLDAIPAALDAFHLTLAADGKELTYTYDTKGDRTGIAPLRAARTFVQRVVSPVISTSLYFIVFGAAIGSRITQIDGVGYGSFIVPGLIMLMLLTQNVTHAPVWIYFPRFVGTIYELLSAPVSPFEIVLGYVGAAATKSLVLGIIILATSWLFVPIHIAHPVWMVTFLVLTAISFSMFGFILGLWADGFEKLQIVPLLILTPLTFLGGTFY